jgi:hypothetical protein
MDPPQKLLLPNAGIVVWDHNPTGYEVGRKRILPHESGVHHDRNLAVDFPALYEGLMSAAFR